MNKNINRLKTTIHTTIAALTLTIHSTGCAYMTGMEETITQDEAAEKVWEHINGVMSSLPEEAELEKRQGMNFASCDDPTDGGPKDRVTVGERLWIRGLPMEENESNIQLVYDYWINNGYHVVHDLRPDELFVTVEKEKDYFHASIQTSNKGSLSIGVTSPCLWPEGTPNS